MKRCNKRLSSFWRKAIVGLSFWTMVMSQVDAAPQDFDSIKPFFDSNTIGFLHIDLETTEVSDFFDLATAISGRPGSKQAAQAEREFQQTRLMVDQWVNSLKEAGATDVFGLFNLTDPEASCLILPAADQMAAEKFQDALPLPTAKIGNAVIIGNTERVKKLLDFGLDKRDDVDQLLALTRGHQVTLGIAPSKDHLKVLRQAMPILPPPLNTLDGISMADGLRQIVFTVDSLDVENFQANLTIHSENAEACAAVAKELGKAFDSIAAGEPQLPDGLNQFIVQLANGFEVTQSENSIVIEARTEQLVMVREAFAPLMARAAKASARTMMANKIRQLAISFHNWADSHKGVLPAWAITDEEGKPLLSWRVQILPLIGQSELYEKFHLDEPWDSPHNIKLVTEMPDLYAPEGGWIGESISQQLRSDGKTMFAIPRGEGMFGHPEGRRFREITDGTSNTIMILTTAPKNAVVWTKPFDVNIDGQSPKSKLLFDEVSLILTVFADGSIHNMDANVDDGVFLQLLQIADGKTLPDE